MSPDSSRWQQWTREVYGPSMRSTAKEIEAAIQQLVPDDMVALREASSKPAFLASLSGLAG